MSPCHSRKYWVCRRKTYEIPRQKNWVDSVPLVNSQYQPFLNQPAERYSGTMGTGASGCDARAERSMAMAAYAMTPVTTQRMSVR